MKSVINNVVEVKVNRVVTGFQPGVGKKSFNSTATTYGQLKTELRSAGFNLQNVRVSEGNTQIDLVNDDAILPVNIQKRGQITNDLIIIMTPKEKPKSGAINVRQASYKELKAEIKALYNSANSAVANSAKTHFGNYTQMSTETMRNFLQAWSKTTLARRIAREQVDAPSASVPTKKASAKSEKEEAVKVEVPSFDTEGYNNAIQHILYGVSLLQDLIPKQVDDSPSEDELEELARKQRNRDY